MLDLPSRRGMSKAATRRKVLQAREVPANGAGERVKAEPGAGRPGVREWLDALPRASGARAAAAFDTRYSFPLAGGAARSIAKGLRRHGYDVAAKPQGFIVDDTERHCVRASVTGLSRRELAWCDTWPASRCADRLCLRAAQIDQRHNGILPHPSTQPRDRRGHGTLLALLRTPALLIIPSAVDPVPHRSSPQVL